MNERDNTSDATASVSGPQNGAERITLTDNEWDPVDGVLIALWQAETERGLDYAADRVRKWAESLIAARVDAALAEAADRINNQAITIGDALAIIARLREEQARD